MSGRHPWSEIAKTFSPEQRQRIEARTRRVIAEMRLNELRRARALTQQDVAETLNVNQPAVAKLEQRTDIYVSSLRNYIEAAGGRLKIIAEFPEGNVAITNFASVGDGDEPIAEHPPASASNDAPYTSRNSPSTVSSSTGDSGAPGSPDACCWP